MKHFVGKVRSKLFQDTHITAAVFVGLFGIVGILILLGASAATGGVLNVSPQGGTLAGGASVISDSSAIGGKAVKFSVSSSGTGTSGGSSTGSGGSTGGSSTSGSGSTSVGCTSGGVAAPCIGGATTGASGWGSPTFQSVFNGTSVNTSQWKVEGPTAPNNSQEYDCYSPNNVSEGGGTLSLKLTSTKCTVGGSSWPDTGAQMDTQSTFNQTYGYYEARVYFPGSGSTVANWGAFWLTNENWPTDGEIDTVEGYHGTAGYHFEYAPSGSAIWQGGQASGNYTGWHIYGVNWQANAITFYYDGKEMGSYTTGTSYNDKPMFILLDYTTAPQNDVGGPSVVPDTMQVQYVRAWK